MSKPAGRASLPVDDDAGRETQRRAAGAPLDWRVSLGGAEPLADGTGMGYGGSGPAQLPLAPILLAVTDQATAERFYQRFKMERHRADLGGPLGAGRRRRPRLAEVGVGDGRRRAPSGGDVSSRRLLGAQAASPERRETVAGECLGCMTQFAIDVRLPLPARCPDCGADVLARANIEGPQGRGPNHSNVPLASQREPQP